MPRRNQHTGTAEPLLATVSANTLTDLELATEMLTIDSFITVDSFMENLVDQDDFAGTHRAAESAEEAEHRLRQLTSRGYLLMSAYRDPATNVFIEYRWAQS